MQIITLSGNPNTGKTTSLKSLYSRLINLGAKDILPPSSCKVSPCDDEYFVNWKGKRIGIVTLGDYAYEIVWYLGVYSGLNADVLIIANSNKGAHLHIINWHEFEHVDIKKTSIDETDTEESILASI